MKSIWVTVGFLAFSGCAYLATPEKVPSPLQVAYQEVNALEQGFLTSSDAHEKITEIQNLSVEANYLADAESLRIGPLGSAITSHYEGSLAGHAFMEQYYRQLESSEASKHKNWIDKYNSYSQYERLGTIDSPYRILTIEDAYALMRHFGWQLVGASYTQTDDYPLIAYLVVTGKEEEDKWRVWRHYFEITAYPVLASNTNVGADLPIHISSDRPIHVVQKLASGHDHAAKVAFGTHLLKNTNWADESRRAQLDLVEHYLMDADKSGNALGTFNWANTVIQQEGPRLRWMDMYALLDRASKLGLTEAEILLAKITLDRKFGDPARNLLIERLKAVAETSNVDALYTLGIGLIEEQPDAAVEYLRRAAVIGTGFHQIQYVKVVTSPEINGKVDELAFDWIQGMAKDEHPDAMVLLANIHAKGSFEQRTSLRKAKRWYRKSVELEPHNGQTVNEVAWVLATSHNKRLRDPELAVAYMEELMTVNQQARAFPGYIDTWAAAYASSGNFTRAIELQKEALTIAEQNGSTEMSEVLRSHLEDFEANKALTEPVP